MKVLEDPTHEGSIRIRIEGLDDLWYLHQVLSQECVVGSHTYRKLEAKDDMLRSGDQPRIKVYLKLRLESSEFHPFTDALRIRGTIIEGPPDISGHHTINASAGSVIDIWKDPLTESDRNLLEEAVTKGGAGSILAVSIDDDSAEVFRLRDYGVERIADVKAGQGGKMYGGGDKWALFYEEVAGVLTHNASNDATVIISGPGFFKEKLMKAINEKRIVPSHQVHLLNSSSGGLSGLKESLSSGKGLAEVVSDIRYVRETQVMEDLMTRIGKGSGAAYGLEEVKRALGIGAVDILLIIDELFRKEEGKELMETALRMGSTSMVISSSHEMGEMLGKLGGAGALLRFDI